MVGWSTKMIVAGLCHVMLRHQDMGKREPQLSQFILSSPIRKLYLICFRGAASEHKILFQTRKNSYRKWTIFLKIFMDRKLCFIRISLNGVEVSGTDMRTLK